MTPGVAAFLGTDTNGRGVTANLTAGGVEIEAISLRAEGNATAKSFGGGGIDVGVIFATVTASPTVDAYIGTGSDVTATGNITILADARSQKTSSVPLNDNFTPTNDVSPSADTITFTAHNLSTGDRVTYDRNGNTAIGTADGGTLSAMREYSVVKVDDNKIRLGAGFGAGAASTGGLFNTASGVDAARDVVRFAAEHRFQTGDAVRYDNGGNTGIGLAANTTYFVRVLDEFTVKVFANRADANETPPSFDPSTSPNMVTSDNFIISSRFTDLDAVTYYGPTPLEFNSLWVDTTGADNGSFDDSQPIVPGNLPINDSNTNRIFLRRDTDGDGTPDTGHGLSDGELIEYRTNGSAITGLSNAQKVYVKRVDANLIELTDAYTSVGSVVFNQVDNANDTATRSDGLSWSSFGFTAGQVINVSGTTNNNGQLTIASVSGNVLNFSGDVLTDETSSAVVRSNAKPLGADKSTSGQQVKHAFVREPLGALNDGQTYYVVQSDGSKFRLSANADGSGPVLNVNDVGRAGLHAFGKAGVELGSSTGNHALYLDLTTQPAGTHKLLGPGGTSLRTARAARDGDTYILNGTKRYITNAPTADLFTVMARTNPEEKGARGVSSFLVEADTPGLRLGKPENKMGQKGAHICDVIFEDCRVPGTAIIGGVEGQGFKTAMKVLDKGRLHIAACCCGIADRLIQESLAFAIDRQQFGKAIAEHQLIQAMLADSQTEHDVGWALVRDAARRYEDGEKQPRIAAEAKYYCSEMLGRVADRAVQIHGGAGYINDYPVARLYRDVRIYRLYEGTSQIQQLVIARDMVRQAREASS